MSRLFWPLHLYILLQYVHLYFVAFDLEDSPGCSSDALRIYDGPLQMDLLRARLCGEEPVSGDFILIHVNTLTSA